MVDKKESPLTIHSGFVALDGCGIGNRSGRSAGYRNADSSNEGAANDSDPP